VFSKLKFFLANSCLSSLSLILFAAQKFQLQFSAIYFSFSLAFCSMLAAVLFVIPHQISVVCCVFPFGRFPPLSPLSMSPPKRKDARRHSFPVSFFVPACCLFRPTSTRPFPRSWHSLRGCLTYLSL